jgi:hypothetical protein
VKIVQSFWSHKFYDFKTREAYNICPTVEHEIYSRALSCLLLSRFYNNLELVTDIKGKELLIDKLGLPYSNVTLELDKLDKYSPELFVLDSIYSIGIQNEPFIYMDENIFLWTPLLSELNDYDIFTLYENDYNYSDETKLFDVASQFETLNSYLYRSMFSCAFSLSQSNMSGFVGGSFNLFFQEYAKEVFSFIDQYMPYLNDIKYIIELNNILTGSFFYNTCKKNKVIPSSYFPKKNNHKKIENPFSNINVGFHHYKYTKNQHQLNELGLMLRLEFPEYYYKIQNFLKEKII